MNESPIRNGLRKNAVPIGIFVALVALAIYRLGSAPTPGAPPPARPPAEAAPPSPAPAVTDSADQSAQAAELDKTLATINEHQQKFDANPKAEDAPSLLSAMGNLYYQRLSNYKEAARCYDLLIAGYPDWPNIKPAYHQLATCYQRLGDRENEQRVYKLMIKAFPVDSQEYLYAKQQLGL